MFARALGLLRVLAKGSRRPRAPFSGGLELLTRGEIGVILRPNSELALLTEWDLQQTFPSLRSSFIAHSAGLYVADLITHLVRDHDPHPGLFDAALVCLPNLGDPLGPWAALLKFQLAALAEAGLRPVLDADARTGEALPERIETAWLHFDPVLGGVVAPASGNPQPEAHPLSSWRVRPSTIALLQSLSRGNDEALPDSDDPRVLRANRLLASYIRHTLGTEPPTMSVVFPTGLSR